MTIKQVLKILEQTHVVNTRVRPDGQIQIIGIDGLRYSGSRGNIAARELVGAPLSSKAIAQRRAAESNRTIRHTSKLQPLPKEVQKALSRAQRAFRESKTAVGKPSTKNVRYSLQKYGVEDTISRLSAAERYGRGLAYLENIRWLEQRIELMAFSIPELIPALSIIRDNDGTYRHFTDVAVREAYSVLYQLENAVTMGLNDEVPDLIDDLIEILSNAVYGPKKRRK